MVFLSSSWRRPDVAQPDKIYMFPGPLISKAINFSQNTDNAVDLEMIELSLPSPFGIESDISRIYLSVCPQIPCSNLDLPISYDFVFLEFFTRIFHLLSVESRKRTATADLDKVI